MTVLENPRLHRFSKRDAPSIITDIEKPFDKNDLIISRTDKRGTIIQCNAIFAKMSGWTEDEIMGSNHNLIRHPDMPQLAYKLVWDIIKDKGEFFGYVKNLRKDGGYYWVFAYIVGEWDDNGNFINFTSYRRYAPRLAVKTMELIYKLLLAVEKRSGMEASERALNKYLASVGFALYDQFIVDLQLRANASMAETGE